MKMKECLSQIIDLLKSINQKMDNNPQYSENTQNTEKNTVSLPENLSAQYTEQIQALKQKLEVLEHDYLNTNTQNKQLEQELETAKSQSHSQIQKLQALNHELDLMRDEMKQAKIKAEAQAKQSVLKELETWTDFQTALLQDNELTQALLGKYVSEATLPQLIRLIAIISQWEQVERVWDELKKRCDREKRPATSAELQLLKMCVQIHNLSLSNHLAELKDVEVGSKFNIKEHTRATPRGDTVQAQWLPELYNAGGIRCKMALVATD